MKVHEIMTAHARCVGPENTLVEAAGLMRELDVGSLPVCDDDRLAGIVTDRDLVLRGIAEGKDPNTTPVREVMTQSVVWAFADQDVEEAVRLMEDRQIRRIPVLSREKRLVGIVALGDIAISSNPAFSGMALRDVSEPRKPNARQRRLAAHSQPPAKIEMRPTNRLKQVRQPSGASTGRRASVRRSSSRSKETVSKSAGARRSRTRAASKKAKGSSRARTRK